MLILQRSILKEASNMMIPAIPAAPYKKQTFKKILCAQLLHFLEILQHSKRSVSCFLPFSQPATLQLATSQEHYLSYQMHSHRMCAAPEALHSSTYPSPWRLMVQAAFWYSSLRRLQQSACLRRYDVTDLHWIPPLNKKFACDGSENMKFSL